MENLHITKTREGITMLVITRKKEEGFKIGKDVIVRILEIDGNQVQVGIEAPPHVKILRLELNENETIQDN